ncbi:MAG: molybdenum cofactor guanylyltransferase [Hydrogenophilaceae bacterium]|nr:molybdenum cofactor guanylyltransferase [Hydrogenophilaceae bacterium]
MSSRPEITAIILAGGQARRMTGQDKGLIELAGRPLIAWVLERIAPQADETLISANRHLETYAKLGYPVVPDRQPDYRGPMAGIYAAGQQARGEWLLAVPCDAPFLPRDLVRRLLDHAIATNSRLVRAADGEQVHYTLLLLHRSLLPDLAAHVSEGRLKLQSWQAERAAETVIFSDEPDAFLNINTPDDLAAAELRAQHAC